MFKEINQAIEWVNTRHRFSKKIDLRQIQAACDLLGNPERSFKIIHIGGTNGKGSTCNFTFNILKQRFKKVGLYVSPYVVCFNERIRFNNEYISNEDIMRLINYLYDFNNEFKKDHDPLTFFEIVTLMSFIYFKERAVEIAVYEVGLGGRLDATNVVSPILTAITNIQKDHMEVLGKTYELIAREKLGIVKWGIPLVTSEKRYSLIKVFKEVLELNNAELISVRNVRNIQLNGGTSFSYKSTRYKASLIGKHQAYNAALAIEIINSLNKFYQMNITKEMINTGLESTKWPGRFEVFANVILDGGHNPEGIRALKNTLELYTSKKINVVFCAMADKETDKMLKIIDTFASKIIFTEINYYRSEKTNYLIKLSHINDKMEIANPKEAVEYGMAITKKDEILLVSGSLYFISQVRDIFVKGEDECLN